MMFPTLLGVEVSADLLSGLATTLGIGGALVWYLWYTVSVAQPKRDEIFTSTIEKVSAGFTECLKEERAFRKMEVTELKQLINENRMCHFPTRYENPHNDT